jgi:hypothetical protein
MKYDVFVSYSVMFSSRAYELSAQLSRENLMCYLDCVESGFSLNDYTRGLLSESRIHVLLVGPGFVTTPYAMASLQCTMGMVKPILVCLGDGAQTLEVLGERCMLSTSASLLEDILSLLKEEDDGEDLTSDSGAFCPGVENAQDPASSFTYAPFLSADEGSPLEESSWITAPFAVCSAEEEPFKEDSHEEKECSEGGFVYTEQTLEGGEGYAVAEDGEEVVYTERRGEEWESLPPGEPSAPAPEVSPELQKILRIIGWVLFVFWMFKWCS